LVYASTWEVYGEPAYQPIDEQHPCSPEHPYSITKLAGERLALSYGQFHPELSVTALRLGTAYGTRMRANSVFGTFIGRALRGEPIIVQGSGSQGRQFTHATDIAAAFDLAIARQSGGAVYNVVSDEMTTIRALAEIVADAIPTSLTFGPGRPGDPPPAVVSNGRARAELGWRPAVAFADGIEQLIEDSRRSMHGFRPP
jgi:UDP-glucose 4-epimerase